MKYTLIGCGRIAPNHITAANENHLEIMALCDLDTAKAAAFKEEQGLNETVKIFKDYEQMFDEVPIDLAAVATSSGDHFKVALAAIRHGIHVIVEKPIALSLDDADQLIEEAKAHNVKLCVNHQNRFNPTIQEIYKAASSGRLGKLMLCDAVIRWYRGKDYYDQASWRGTFEQDGGALMNQCIHNIDLLRWMMGGEIEEVVGYTKNDRHSYLPVEDLGIALVKFKNGSLGKIEGSVNIYPEGLEETLSVFGTKGTVRAGGMSVNHMDVWNVDGEENSLLEIQERCNENPENVYGFGHVPLYRNMIEAITENKEPLVSGLEGRKALEVVLGIYLSGKTGKKVSFPLYHVSTLDFI